MNSILQPTPGQDCVETAVLHADTPCISGMTDAELDAHILDCGRQIVRADALYQAHGCFNDKAARDAAAIAQTLALKARMARRTPQQVRELEVERGIA